MDSISQIVLGAAVGEAVLGKRLGNKAIFWGAVGGTIPDLDVITSPLLSEVDSLAFHRGFSHSISFAVLGGMLFGWLCFRLYGSPYYRRILLAILSLFISCIPVSIYFFLFSSDNLKYVFAALAILLSVGLYYFLDRRHFKKMESPPHVPLRQWQWMFFLAFITHALLDCFTMYGTQLFSPFSDFRVAFSSISVADPFGYTLPFLICLIMASRFPNNHKKRRFYNWLGIGLSSAYLIFTLFHKQKIKGVFEKQLVEQNITYDRLILGPSIFQNVLWSATVESEEVFYQGQYSIFDTSKIKFNSIPKNHHLIPNSEDDRTINILKWFSNNFYNVIRRKDGRLQFNDLRFGTFRGTGDENDYIFRFIIEQLADGHYEMQQTQGGPQEGDRNEIFKALYERIKGI